MKNRFFACLLSAVLLFGMVSCKDDTKNEEPPTTTTAAAVTTTAPEQTTEEPPVIGGNTTETVVKLNGLTTGIHVFGIREEASDSVINCNNPGSGFELAINSKGGNVNVRTRTADPCTFRVFVDGEAWKNANGSEDFTINGVKNIEIPSISEGEHTIRVIRISEQGAGAACFYNATFEGTQKMLSPVENALRVEFVGDNSVLGADVTKAYAYLTAGKLNAAYAVSAFVGQGVVTGTSPVPNAYGKSGSCTDAADIVVIDLGAADLTAGTSAADLTSAYGALLAAVREVNGPVAKIVCLSSANDALHEVVTATCTAAGGEGAGYFAKALTASDAAAVAEELASYLTSIKDLTVETLLLTGAASGYGVEIDYNAGDWIA